VGENTNTDGLLVGKPTENPPLVRHRRR